MLKMTLGLLFSLFLTCLLGCSKRQAPICINLSAGQNDMVISCEANRVLVRIYERGYAEGKKTGFISVSGFLKSGNIKYALAPDEHPSAPKGTSDVYQVWVQVADGEIEAHVNIKQGKDVIMIVSLPYP